MTRVGELWRRGQLGWPRGYPLVQAPNAPLFAAIAGWALAAVSSGLTADLGRVISVLGLGVWAVEEVLAGVNAFRRLLGAAVLLWLLLGLL